MLSKIFSAPKYLSKPNKLSNKLKPINQEAYLLEIGFHKASAYTFATAVSQPSSTVEKHKEPQKISLEGLERQQDAKVHKPHSIKEYIYEMIGAVKNGSRQTWRDLKYLRSIRKQKAADQFTAFELKNIRSINQNLVKLVPFAFFIVIPLAELFLPFYLVFFPNATPKAFMTPSQITSKQTSLLEKQKEAFGVLSAYLKNKMIGLGCDQNMTDPDSMTQFLLSNKKMLEKELNFNNLDSKLLKRVCEFMMIDHFDGTNIVTQIYRYSVTTPRYMLNIFRKMMGKPAVEWNHPLGYTLNLNYFPVKYMQKNLLLAHIRSNMKALDAQNLSMIRIGIDAMSEGELREVALERGIRARELSEVKLRLQNEWSTAIKELNGSGDLLFWSTVINYHK